jgi:hypothetical protein
LFIFRDGNLADVALAGSLHEFLLELHDKYGSIASFWWGNQLVISIASAELFQQHIGIFDRPRKYDEAHLKNGFDFSESKSHNAVV